MKKKGKKIYIVLISLLILLVVAAVFKGKSGKPPLEVYAGKVQLRTINQIVSGSGKIYPETEVKISSDVSGEIIKLKVKEGDSVKANQILAIVNPDTYQSMVERARASLNNAKAQYANARSRIGANIAQKEQILSKLHIAKLSYERNKKLHTQKVIADADFDKIKATYNELQASLKSAEANIVAAKESAKAAQYMVKSAEATLKEALANLKRTTIISPIDGIVTMLAVEEGERVVGTIQMKGTEMMRISNLDNMEVRVEISENDILKVKEGDTADIEVDAYIDKKFTGKVIEVANSASNITLSNLNSDRVTNFIVKIRIDKDSYADLITKNPEKFPFRPGMSATVDIFTDKITNAKSVPIQAVTVRDSDTKDTLNITKEIEEVVFVIEADTVKKVRVKTGIQDDEFIQLIEGPDIGTKVVTGPYKILSKNLKQGDKIKIKKHPKSSNK